MKIVTLVVTLFGCLLLSRFAQAQSAQSFTGEIGSDFRYLANNSEADAEDVLTSPLRFPDLFAPDGLLRKPAFYYTLLGAGAVLGSGFALDETIRARVRQMGNATANDLETTGNFVLWGSTGLVYMYGLYGDDAQAREYMVTSVEGAGIGSLITVAFKAIFGRARPREGKGAFAYFTGGESFVSGAATPVFSLAAGISDYADYRWYVAVPAYATALAVGFGRMGKDAHWFSDVLGSALVGAGTTELLLYLHRAHSENPSRFRVFPVGSTRAAGAGISFEF